MPCNFFRLHLKMLIIHVPLLSHAKRRFYFFCRWGTPYLTREFFHYMASKLGDGVLLVLAEENEEPVAGALNLIGGDTLFGRLWGCRPDSYYPSLHFEACYYQVCLLVTKSIGLVCSSIYSLLQVYI